MGLVSSTGAGTTFEGKETGDQSHAPKYRRHQSFTHFNVKNINHLDQYIRQYFEHIQMAKIL